MSTPLDRATLQKLREQNPAWRLLAATHAPFIISFLHQAFLASNTRTVSQQALASRLEDHLHEGRSLGGLDLPKRAEAYLDDWAGDSGWLRKFYPMDSDEAHFDLTAAAERAIVWVTRLLERRFVGTQSRLLTVFQLLSSMVEGSEVDPNARLAELQRRRDAIDQEMERLRAGLVDVMAATELRERFQLMASTARELLADFRELEQSFHLLDRDVRQRIATWSGGRGALIADILGERDALSSSDQGTSFRAFWDFLMSPDRQEELTQKLQHVFELEAIRQTAPDPRLRRIHYDWLAAGEATQRTVARLSEQLRRYLDDRVFLENRRILEVIRSIEQQALAFRNSPPSGTVAELDDVAPAVELPLERPLFAPPFVARLTQQLLEAGEEDVASDGLFEQVAVDRARLRTNIQHLLQRQERITLAEVVAQHPLQHGLAELVSYLAVASENRKSVFDEQSSQRIEWNDRRGQTRSATIPLVVFTR
ncbi:DUF3375 domain-containing protein [Archangium violaceum]|uniref:DUF3375 domain-containing protein n=1 Tax=Archangium violaceum TaxID=83451 RepID=UPI00193AE8EE|nr:DUF3375 domain-containing protein [Archangium violaceum]QRK05184.1 DUF3375 domain-containing protein [Archangium violaceum]